MTIVSKNQLVNSINADISNNSNQEISPEDIRHNLIDLVDSVHLLLDSTKDITIEKLTSSNFYTPSNRSTIVGEEAISKLHLDSYVTNDNTAVGYASLKNNYQGSGNTSVGTFALSCNIFGDNNSAFGVNSLSANTNGFANVGVGNYALTRNKTGDFNIAIGHGAGYYSKDENYKLFIANHPANEEYVCDNPLGSGLTPLIYGNLLNEDLVLGVGTRTLYSHSIGVIQSSGAISPTLDNTFDIGHKDYKWQNVHTQNIVLASGAIITNHTSHDVINVSGNISPFDNRKFHLGSSNAYFASGYISHLFTDVTNTISDNHYEGKVLYVASSGDPPDAYLTPEQLSGGGIVVRGSGEGTDQSVDYAFLFRPSGESSVPFYSFEDYNHLSRSFWESNISLHISSGSHVHTPRLLNSGELDLVVYSPDQPEFGMYLNSGALYVTSDSGGIFGINPGSSSGLLAGMGSVNMLSPSGINDYYFLTVGSLESGVTVGQRFITGAKQREKDDDGLDKLNGFTHKYIDASNTIYSGPKVDRFVISSHDNSSYGFNNLILMKNHSNGGILGVNNFSEGGDAVIPQTSFNVRTNHNAAVRITAENAGQVSSALQLLTNLNCLSSGFEIKYNGGASGVAEFNMYDASGLITAAKITKDGNFGILSSGSLNRHLTVGDDGSPNAVIAIHIVSGLHPSFSAIPNHSQIYSKEMPSGTPTNIGQTLRTFTMDGDGNELNMTRNVFLHGDGLVYQDGRFNTFAGLSSTLDRQHLNTAFHNTGYGNGALALNTSGNYNTALGSLALSGVVESNYNIAIGYGAGASSSGNYNLLIGNSLNAVDGESYKFKLGANSSNVLMSGCTGPLSSDRVLFLPNGKLSVQEDNNKSLYLSNNLIKVINHSSATQLPPDSLSLDFSHSVSGARLVEFNHAALPMSGFKGFGVSNPNYTEPNMERPYVGVSGDIKLLGAIRFSNGDSLESTEDITNLSESGAFVSGVVFSTLPKFREGFMIDNVGTAPLFTSPTSGFMTVYDQNGSTSEGVFITNRDKHSSLTSGDYIVAININNEFRPLWINNEDLACNTCCK